MHIPNDAAVVGRLAGSSETASLCLLRVTGAGAKKGGGGGGIRILKGRKQTKHQFVHHTRFMKKNTQGKYVY